MRSTEPASEELADEDHRCPICGAVSDRFWRCSECGKLFDNDGTSGGGRSVTGGNQ